ncbi:MAG TPA: hypothetical protein VGM36_10190 [Rhizomicrobium sp.]|jgi:hypothetical protein
MSELINTSASRTGIRRQLMASASALVLLASIYGTQAAKAEDTERPTVWFELGGQLERVDGGNTPFAPKFLTQSPTPNVYDPVSPVDAQRTSRYSYGGEGKISFQPEGSDWVFAAGLRYGRANGGRQVDHQSKVNYPYVAGAFQNGEARYEQLSQTQTHNSQSDLLIDFTVGKDVGLGLFGRHSSSVLSAGIRFAQFTARDGINNYARPHVGFENKYDTGSKYLWKGKFHNYMLQAERVESFRGVGPSLQWNSSDAIVGNPDSTEVMFDWGINAALLFGRQKTKLQHRTQDAYFRPKVYTYNFDFFSTHSKIMYDRTVPHTRSRSVVVPNVGGFAGFSLRWPNAKVSLGYRADYFFGAMDTGIDTRQTKDRSFYGPFASISIGLGG